MGLSREQIRSHIVSVVKGLSEREKKLRGYEFAKLSYQTKDYDEAVGYLLGYLEIKPLDFRARMWMGKLYELINDKPKAIYHYERCLELKGDQKDIILKVAELCQQLKDPPLDKMKKYLALVKTISGAQSLTFSLKKYLSQAEVAGKNLPSVNLESLVSLLWDTIQQFKWELKSLVGGVVISGLSAGKLLSFIFRVDRGLHEAYYLWKSVDVSKGRCFYQTVVRELCGQLYMMIAQYLYLTGRHSSYTGLLPSQEVQLGDLCLMSSLRALPSTIDYSSTQTNPEMWYNIACARQSIVGWQILLIASHRKEKYFDVVVQLAKSREDHFFLIRKLLENVPDMTLFPNESFDLKKSFLAADDSFLGKPTLPDVEDLTVCDQEFLSSGKCDVNTLVWLYLAQKALVHISPVSDWFSMLFPSLLVTSESLLQSTENSLSRSDLEAFFIHLCHECEVALTSSPFNDDQTLLEALVTAPPCCLQVSKSHSKSWDNLVDFATGKSKDLPRRIKDIFVTIRGKSPAKVELPNPMSTANGEEMMLERKSEYIVSREYSGNFDYVTHGVSDLLEPPKSEKKLMQSKTTFVSIPGDSAVVISDISEKETRATKEQSNQLKSYCPVGMQKFSGLFEDSTWLEKGSIFQSQESDNQMFSSQQGCSDKSVEYEPDVDFKPVVSLPDSYKYKSINDDSEVLFDHRCKLFRFDELSKKWKERGFGNIQILQQPLTKKSRILMRREQILKVCCNHYITEDMKLVSKDNDRSWAWQSYADFSDEALKKEMFVVRFKTARVAEEFKKLFEDCVEKASLEKQVSRVPETQPSSREEKELSEWKCTGCHASNLASSMTCMVCCALRSKVDERSLPDQECIATETVEIKIPESPVCESGNVSNAGSASILSDSHGHSTPVSCMNTTHSKKQFSTELERILHDQTDAASLFSGGKDMFDHHIAPSSLTSELSNAKLEHVVLPASEEKPFSNVVDSDQVTPLGIPPQTPPNGSKMFDSSKENFEISNRVISPGKSSQSDNLTHSESEVIFSHEDLPDKESVAKAEALMLPPSFYLYETIPKCSGCRGCSEDFNCEAHSVSNFSSDTIEPKSEQEVIQSIPKDTTSASTKTSDVELRGTREQSATDNQLKLYCPTGMLSFSDLAKEKPTWLEKKSISQFQGSGNQLFSSQQGNNDTNVEYEPDVDFKPVVSLPDSYEYKYINDDSEVLFEQRCTLFRYDELLQQWKERGLGNIQILQQPLTKKSRILMRREQILKVCCNHYITEDMKLMSKDNDRCWVWQSHADFSDEMPKKEMFVARFKTASIAETFKKLFEDCVKKASTVKVYSKVDPGAQPFLKDKKDVFKWECTECYVSNLASSMTCVACSASRPKLENNSVPEKERTATDAVELKMSGPCVLTECTEIHKQFSTDINKNLHDRADASSLLDSGSRNLFDEDIAPSSSSSELPHTRLSLSSSPTLKDEQFSEMVDSDCVTHPATPSGTPPGVSPISPSSLEILDSSRENVIISENDTLPCGHSSKLLDSSHDSEISWLFEELPDVELIEKAERLMLPRTFYMYEKKLECKGCRGCTDDFCFDTHGVSNSALGKPERGSEEILTTTIPSEGSAVFTSIPQLESKELTTGSLLKSCYTTGMLSFSDLAKKEPTWLEKKSSFQFQGSGNQLFCSQQEDNKNVDYEPEVDFKPLVSLQDSYEYASIKDDSEVLFEHRCKLFRFDESSKQWKERGLGNIKILQQPLTKKSRVLMRREQILKVCCNHYITQDMKLMSKDNDRCWTWQSQADFSDETSKKEVFVVKFKMASVAEIFKNIFENCVSMVKPETKLVRNVQATLNDEKEFSRWECTECFVFNLASIATCVACSASRPNVSSGFKETSEVVDSGAIEATESRQLTNSKSVSIQLQWKTKESSTDQIVIYPSKENYQKTNGNGEDNIHGGITESSHPELPQDETSMSPPEEKNLKSTGYGEDNSDGGIPESPRPELPQDETSVCPPEEKNQETTRHSEDNSDMEVSESPRPELPDNNDRGVPESFCPELPQDETSVCPPEEKIQELAGNGVDNSDMGVSELPDNSDRGVPELPQDETFVCPPEEKNQEPTGNSENNSDMGVSELPDNSDRGVLESLCPELPQDETSVCPPEEKSQELAGNGVDNSDMGVSELPDNSDRGVPELPQDETFVCPPEEKNQEPTGNSENNSDMGVSELPDNSDRGVLESLCPELPQDETSVCPPEEKSQELAGNGVDNSDMGVSELPDNSDRGVPELPQDETFVCPPEEKNQEPTGNSENNSDMGVSELPDNSDRGVLESLCPELPQDETSVCPPEEKSQELAGNGGDNSDMGVSELPDNSERGLLESPCSELPKDETSVCPSEETNQETTRHSEDNSDMEVSESLRPELPDNNDRGVPESIRPELPQDETSVCPPEEKNQEPTRNSENNSDMGVSELPDNNDRGVSVSPRPELCQDEISVCPPEETNQEPTRNGENISDMGVSESPRPELPDNSDRGVLELPRPKLIQDETFVCPSEEKNQEPIGNGEDNSDRGVPESPHSVLPQNIYVPSALLAKESSGYDYPVTPPGSPDSSTSTTPALSVPTKVEVSFKQDSESVNTPVFCDNEEVCFLSEELPCPELIVKAEALMLPRCFYLYEKKPECTGCRGCFGNFCFNTNGKISQSKDIADSNSRPELVKTSSKLETVISPSNNERSSIENKSSLVDQQKLYYHSEMLSFSDLAREEPTWLEKKSSFQFRGSGNPLFSSQQRDNNESVEYEPDVNFKPVVLLPDSYVYKCADENSKVLFEHRCKLFRYDNISSTWKERGIGNIQILQQTSVKSKIVMRRDQVLKVCCNHYITESMKLMPRDNDRCWTWQSLADVSDDAPSKVELFVVRFKTPSVAEHFRSVFDNCVKKACEVKSEPVSDIRTSIPPKNSHQWECSNCFVINQSSAEICVACSTSRPKMDIKGQEQTL